MSGVIPLSKITAIIPAAGYSSRMGLFKPLLTIGSSLVIEKSVATFREAGINDIRVIVGHKAHLLLPVLERLGVKIIVNEYFEHGMYTSVQKGVKTLDNDSEAFFFLPVDYALVKPDTVRRLMHVYAEKPCDVIYPVYMERSGHPPLISADFKEAILSKKPIGGLKELLTQTAQETIEVSVDDKGILLDMDSETDYLNLIRGTMPIFPTRQECLDILKKFQPEEQIIGHILAVTRTAEMLSEFLISRGLRINLGIVMAAAMLHDIAKGEKDHARKGQEIIHSLGYPEIADIIGTHMELQPEQVDEANERTILYLADKITSGDHFVPLNTRLTMGLEKYKDKEAQDIIQKRIKQAEAIKQRVEKVLGYNLEDILQSEVNKEQRGLPPKT